MGVADQGQIDVGTREIHDAYGGNENKQPYFTERPDKSRELPNMLVEPSVSLSVLLSHRLHGYMPTAKRLDPLLDECHYRHSRGVGLKRK
jgi:hypothetical protein